MQNNQVYFKDIRNIIIEQIQLANSEILIAVAWLTDEKIISVLEAVARKNIKIKIVFYDDKINKKDLFRELYISNVDIRVSKKLMHNKFCIIDKSTVINGSYNWTYNASNNHENITVSQENKRIAKEFTDEFISIFNSGNKIDEHFKNLLQNIEFDEEEFDTFFKKYKNNNKFPYFYNVNENTSSKTNIQSSIKKGFYLIKDFCDEEKLYSVKYYTELKYDLKEVAKVLKKDFKLPQYFKNIAQFNNSDNLICEIVDTKYIVEENQASKNFVFYIDTKGNTLGDKIQFHYKLPNGNYLSHFTTYQQLNYIIDKHLTTKNHDFINPLIVGEIGIVARTKVYEKYAAAFYNISDIHLYGMYDFNGKKLVENLFNEHKVNIEKGIIDFIEEPILYYWKSSAASNQIVYNNRSLFINNYRFDERIKRPYKIFRYNIKERKFLKIVVDEIINNDVNKEFLFLSDDSRKNSDFYLAYISCSSAFSIKDFNNCLEIFSKQNSHPSNVSKYNEAVSYINRYSTILQQNKKAVIENNSKNCYIATLAYQNIDHPQVQYLREFRDGKLNDIYLGRAFVKFYYKFSPRLVILLGNKTFTNYFLRMVIDLLIKILKMTNLLSSKK